MSIELTDIEGVFANGINSGIKKEKLDLGFIYVPDSYSSAGVFTRNKFCAACVDYNRKLINDKQTLKLILVNSGNANAVTGEIGKQNLLKSISHASERFDCSSNEIAMASTGIIGRQLPMELVLNGIDTLAENKHEQAGANFAKAILTTDLVAKKASISRVHNGIKFNIAGVAKGSGMIAPNLATMLSFLVTDLAIEQGALQQCLSSAVEESFNMISVDTDTSTSDMVLIISSGAKKVAQDEGLIDSFKVALTEVCVELAKKITRDGEGAQKLLEVCVSQAASVDEARRIAKSIIESPLVKTAIHGGDPNWGRVIMAVGKTRDVQVLPEKTSLYFQGVQVLAAGLPVDFDRDNLKKKLSEAEIEIEVQLGVGDARARAWGCDLTRGYIDINVEYN